MKLTLINGTNQESQVYKKGRGYSFLLEDGDDTRLILDVGSSKNFFYNARFLDTDFRRISSVVVMSAFTNNNGFLKKTIKKSYKARLLINEHVFSDFKKEEGGKLKSLSKSFKNKSYTTIFQKDYKVSDKVTLFSFPLDLDRHDVLENESKDLIEHEVYCFITNELGNILVIMNSQKPIKEIIDYTEKHFKTKIGYVVGTIPDSLEDLKPNVYYYDVLRDETTNFKRPVKIGNTLDFTIIDDFGLKEEEYEF